VGQPPIDVGEKSDDYWWVTFMFSLWREFWYQLLHGMNDIPGMELA
jgi:hypothetical protein